jgi:hypothetical protein
VYVDDIVIIGSDHQKIKHRLCHYFQTKNYGRLQNFLVIEMAQSKDDIVISNREHIIDILGERGLINHKPVGTPMNPNAKILPNHGEPLSNPKRYTKQNYPNLLFQISPLLLIWKVDFSTHLVKDIGMP